MKVKKKCEECDQVIPKERLEAIPDTKRCVNCSSEKRKLFSMEGDENIQVLVEIPSGERPKGFIIESERKSDFVLAEEAREHGINVD